MTELLWIIALIAAGYVLWRTHQAGRDLERIRELEDEIEALDQARAAEHRARTDPDFARSVRERSRRTVPD